MSDRISQLDEWPLLRAAERERERKRETERKTETDKEMEIGAEREDGERRERERERERGREGISLIKCYIHCNITAYQLSSCFVTGHLCYCASSYLGEEK